MKISQEKAKAWLSAKDSKRKQAVQEAADILLTSYRSRAEWLEFMPIELHRLAASLNTRIEALMDMEGEAMLVPSKKGFRIVIKRDVNMARYRTSIAHELAHTLFYLFDGNVPQRMFKPSNEEERFCFDVARRILAPECHLRSLGILSLQDPQQIFEILTSKLKISRPVAARIVLQDHCLLVGVGGRWKKSLGGWKLQRGNAYASPTLSVKQRRMFHDRAREFLRIGHETNSEYKIVSFFEYSGEAAFVIVVKG